MSSTNSFRSRQGELITVPCGTHSLTGLCSAIYLAHAPDRNVVQVKAPSPVSGLYIRARGGELTKVAIPPDCVTFQTEEALELRPRAGSVRPLTVSESGRDQERGMCLERPLRCLCSLMSRR